MVIMIFENTKFRRLLSILSILLLLISCNNIKRMEVNNNIQIDSLYVPKDYYSVDGTSEVKYHENGKIKLMNVQTNTYFDSINKNQMYVYQTLEFSKEGKLIYCLITVNDNNWFEYYKDSIKGDIISGEININSPLLEE